MAKFLNTDIYVSVNGVDLSDHAFGVSTPQTREQIDVSGFNSTGAKEFLSGSRDDSVTINFLQDFASSKVHQTLSPLFANSSTFGFEIRPTSTVVSATNPRYWGTASLFTYSGLDGQINNRSEITAELKASTVAGFVWSST
jgi:hypothetical protein